jgi:hypothetical protein
VLGKALSDSGLVDWLRNPTPSLKKILDGISAGQVRVGRNTKLDRACEKSSAAHIHPPADTQAPTNGDVAGVLEEFGPRLPGFCAGLAEGSCCAGSAMEMLGKLMPTFCLGRVRSSPPQPSRSSPRLLSNPRTSTFLKIERRREWVVQLGIIFAGLVPLCSNTGHPIPAACGGVDYSGLGSAPSSCPDITSVLNQLYSLKPLSSSQYAGCTLPANTCPRNDCELMWCK